MSDRKVAPVSLRFFEPRMIDYPGDWEGDIFSCPQCLKCYSTEMARAHHTIQNHCVALRCFGCDEMVSHVISEHPKKHFSCYFCKSKWNRVKSIKLSEWQHIRHHIYGELVYEKISEYRQDENEQVAEPQPDLQEFQPKQETVEYCYEQEIIVKQQ